MHDRPLRSDRLQPPLRLLRGQFDRGRAAQVDMQPTSFHEHAAPNYMSRLADSVKRASTQPEVHRRLIPNRTPLSSRFP